MTLYPKNTEDELKEELFKNPTAEYRGAPFWAWNCKLDKETLCRQIEIFKAMGLGGFHMHPRTGLATPYLGDEFMEMVAACNEKAKQEQMLAWLYDEDRWPSGYGGGLVTKEKQYRAKYLLATREPQELTESTSDVITDSRAQGFRSKDFLFIADYEVLLENGLLSYYKRLEQGAKPSMGGKVWHVYLNTALNSSWFNNQSYVNTLDSAAIKKFIEITHCSYKKVIGNDFGKSVPAIFTDEPQFVPFRPLGYANEEHDIVIPFTDDFPDTYKAAYGDDLLDKLPELIWDLPEGKASLTRYRFFDHLSERFAEAYSDTIGKWCDENGILFTGHLMEEPTLGSQTSCLGEAMRQYRGYSLPGIDILCDFREFTTAKQAQSAAHQYGRPGVLSELYGVTNWDYDFRNHKSQGDWQAALGVTVRVHHLTWVSMKGEAKRDYPASMGEHVPWHTEYQFVENHFARLNTALTRGEPIVKIGVIHPVESYWLRNGPLEFNRDELNAMDESFQNTTKWLLESFLDFDFIAESLLSDLCSEQITNKLQVGKMAYSAVVVPDCLTLRSTTLEKLKTFRKSGGEVIFAGRVPTHVDAVESDSVEQFARECITIPLRKADLTSVLAPFRSVDMLNMNGSRAENLLHQYRTDGDKRWLFICKMYPPEYPDTTIINKYELRIKGEWIPELWNTQTGDIERCSAKIVADETILTLNMSEYDSFLFRLVPGKPNMQLETIGIQPVKGKSAYLTDPAQFELSEPNVLLMDMAEFAFDDGDWQSREELLRIENKFRSHLGYALRTGGIAQPWVMPSVTEKNHLLRLKFKIFSDIKVDNCKIALEDAECAVIKVNGELMEGRSDGYFVDASIQTITIPIIRKGLNEIIVEYPFGESSEIEWCYLLGDFGVSVSGSYARLIEPARSLTFGDWRSQGLPFYAGNVKYRFEILTEGGNALLEATHYRGAVLKIVVDGKDAGYIAYAPYLLDLGYLSPGKHSLEILCFGNRVNAFGPVHLSDPGLKWIGPNAWRTEGAQWSYEYQLKQTGLLTAPKLWIQ